MTYDLCRLDRERVLLDDGLIVPFSDSGHENPSLPGQSESPVSESESEFPLCALLRTPQRLGSGPEMCPDTSDPPPVVWFRPLTKPKFSQQTPPCDSVWET